MVMDMKWSKKVSLIIFLISLSLLMGSYFNEWLYGNSLNLGVFLIVSSLSFETLYHVFKPLFKNKKEPSDEVIKQHDDKVIQDKERKEDLKLDINQELEALKIEYLEHVQKTGKRDLIIEEKIKQLDTLVSETNVNKIKELKRIRK